MTEAGDIVPWLAVKGELAYSPECPPDRDYFFQYGWVLPEVLQPDVRRSRHWYFGSPCEYDVGCLLQFWNDARAGRVDRVAVINGRVNETEVRSPLALYRGKFQLDRERLVLMQHGSYLLVDPAEQPAIEDGFLTIYRGIGDEATFNFCMERESSAWGCYTKLLADVLSDSVRSFNSIHDRVKRAETSHIHDGTWMTDGLAKEHGLETVADGTGKRLWNSVQQSFGLERWVAQNKFGPHYVVAKTPFDNVRITTMFAGEVEVKVVDPSRVEFLQTVGCSLATNKESWRQTRRAYEHCRGREQALSTCDDHT